MVTCGTDIIKISRVKDSIEKIGETFLKRVYTDEEIEYCESRRMCKYQSYAARFAAKEAVYKAISPVDGKEATWKDIEVCKCENGKPYIKLYGELKKIADKEKIKNIEISLSHDDDYAIACVVIDKENE
ncbi:MAG: holo-ACP synthase [Clostridia bacterium]|nr:holo-ACP synthase [Clostridia bacterium]